MPVVFKVQVLVDGLIRCGVADTISGGLVAITAVWLNGTVIADIEEISVRVRS